VYGSKILQQPKESSSEGSANIGGIDGSNNSTAGRYRSGLIFLGIARLQKMATQFYSALNYLNTHHDFVPVNDSPAVSDPQGATHD